MIRLFKKNLNKKETKIEELEKKINTLTQYYPSYPYPYPFYSPQFMPPTSPTMSPMMSPMMSPINMDNYKEIEKIKKELKELNNKSNGSNGSNESNVSNNSSEIITFEYNLEIIVYNMKQLEGILDHIKTYLINLLEYLKKCIDLLIKISPPTTPSLIYDSSRNAIIIYLTEFDRTVLNAVYNDIHLLHHHKLGTNTPIKFAIFICPDKRIEKEIINCIKGENIYMNVQVPCVDIHSLQLQNYIHKPLTSSEIMTSESNPFPPNNFGIYPDYYSKLNSKLKKNWDFRTHLNKFNGAINKISLEIDKLDIYKNGLNIKRELLDKIKHNYLKKYNI